MNTKANVNEKQKRGNGIMKKKKKHQKEEKCMLSSTLVPIL